MSDSTPRRLRLAAVAVLLLAFMTAAVANRVVRGAGLPDEAWTPAVMLAGFRSLPPAGPPDVVGIVELYRDGTIVVPTTGGVREIRLNAATVVTRPNGQATLADLRPGTTVAVWGRRSWWGTGFTARALIVLGG